MNGLKITGDRDVANCQKFNVPTCTDVVNAFMQKDCKNRVDPDETPQNVVSHQGLCYLPC